MSGEVVSLPRKTYTAKSFRATVSGLDVDISGTLDGFLDLSIRDANGKGWTYSLTPDDARVIAAHLLGAASDVQQNCLYDRDALLMP